MTRGLVLFDVVAGAAAARPAADALVEAGRATTYRQLHGRSEMLAGALRRYGLSRGDRVAVWCDGGTDAVAAVVAVLRCGGVVVPIAADAPVELAAASLRATRPRTVITTRARTDAVAAAVGARPTTVVCLGEDGPDGDLADPAVVGVSSPVPFLRVSDATAALAVGVGDDARRIRHAVVSHRAMWLRTRGPARFAEPGRYALAGRFGSPGVVAGLFRAWQSRGEAVLWTPGDPVTPDTVVVASAGDVIDAAARDDVDWSGAVRIEVEAAAPTGELVDALDRVAPGVPAGIAFVTVAAGPIASGALDDPARPPASCGAMDPLVTVEILEGEIHVSSPMLMTDWFEDPDATSAALVDDRLATGITGVLDADGHLTVTGRVDRTIPVGADDVDPAEVERVLLAHPAVADVVVVGVPDPDTGQALCAVVVAAGDPPEPAEIADHVRTRLARSRQPTRIVVSDELPVTGGTVNRHLVRETALARLEVELQDDDEPGDGQDRDDDQRG